MTLRLSRESRFSLALGSHPAVPTNDTWRGISPLEAIHGRHRANWPPYPGLISNRLLGHIVNCLTMSSGSIKVAQLSRSERAGSGAITDLRGQVFEDS